MKIEDLEKALQYFVIAVPESEEQAKAYFWARKALTALRSMPETTKPGWISVKERLPNFGIPVLICWDGYTDIAEYRCGMVCPKWRTQHYGTVDLASVTHWMPLPEPPEEG